MKNVRTHFDRLHALGVIVPRSLATVTDWDNEILDGLREIIQEARQSVKTRVINVEANNHQPSNLRAAIRELLLQNAQQPSVLAIVTRWLWRSTTRCAKFIAVAVNDFARRNGCDLNAYDCVRHATKNSNFGRREISLGIYFFKPLYALHP